MFSYSSNWKRAGNPAWMAPELVNNDEPPPRSPVTDVFSFGRMMIEVSRQWFLHFAMIQR